MRIIDLSEFNIVTDWQQVKKSVDLVILRIGYRGSWSGKITYDKKYKEYRKACEKHGIPHGFYYFPTSITEKEAKEEADFVAKELADIKSFPCPVWADAEYVDYDKHSGRADNLSKAVRTQMIRTFCDRLQSHKIPAGVYSYTSFFQNNLDMSKLPFSVWLADYSSKPTYSGDFLMWQYTSSGEVPGISGRVDMSILKSDIPTTNTKADEVLRKAASFIGVKESPANSNNVIFNIHYYGRAVSGPAYPWCCAFVWDIFRLCGASNLFYGGKKTAYCPTAMNWYKSQNRLFTTPQRGDVVFFNFNGGKEATHIGFVENVTGTGIVTIEGNTSVSSNDNGGSVMRRNRPLSVCIGFGRPNYGKVQPTTPKVDTSGFPTIKRGSAKKDYVLLLQNALTVRGYPVAIDGVFGKDTEAKVKQFQGIAGLVQDGIVGPLTWNALFN